MNILASHLGNKSSGSAYALLVIRHLQKQIFSVDLKPLEYGPYGQRRCSTVLPLAQALAVQPHQFQLPFKWIICGQSCQDLL